MRNICIHLLHTTIYYVIVVCFSTGQWRNLWHHGQKAGATKTWSWNSEAIWCHMYLPYLVLNIPLPIPLCNTRPQAHMTYMNCKGDYWIHSILCFWIGGFLTFRSFGQAASIAQGFGTTSAGGPAKVLRVGGGSSALMNELVMIEGYWRLVANISLPSPFWCFWCVCVCVHVKRYRVFVFPFVCDLDMEGRKQLLRIHKGAISIVLIGSCAFWSMPIKLLLALLWISSQCFEHTPTEYRLTIHTLPHFIPLPSFHQFKGQKNSRKLRLSGFERWTFFAQEVNKIPSQVPLLGQLQLHFYFWFSPCHHELRQNSTEIATRCVSG